MPDDVRPLTADEARQYVAALLEARVTMAKVAYLFELSPQDLGQFLDGDDGVWLTKRTPAYHRRLRARVRAKMSGLVRQAEQRW